MNRYSLPKASLVQLRSFEAVARLGGITKAARELCLTQPTVSNQIKELQHGVGVDLLEPVGRGVQLTDAGRDLLLTVQTMLDTWAGFELQISERGEMVRGSLRIAGVTTTEYFLAQWLRPFADSFPGVDVDLVVENRDAVVGRLEKGWGDLAVMMTPPVNLPLIAVPVMENPLCLIAALNHRWAKRRILSLERLNEEKLLLREVGSGTRQTSLEFLATHSLTPIIRMTLGSNEAIKHAVAAGLGIAIVSRHAIAENPAQDNLCILKVAGFPILRTWHVVRRADRRLSRAASIFLEYLDQAVGIKPS